MHGVGLAPSLTSRVWSEPVISGVLRLDAGDGAAPQITDEARAVLSKAAGRAR